MPYADPEARRACQRESARRHYAANREEMIARSRRDYEKNGDARRASARERARKRASYRLGAKPFCKRGHPLVEGNIDAERRCLICKAERRRRASRKRYHADIEHSRAKARNRVMGIAGDEDVEYAELVRRDSCSYCGDRGGEADHIVPVAAGGIGEAANLTGACRSCNAAKGDEPLLSFLLVRPLS